MLLQREWIATGGTQRYTMQSADCVNGWVKRMRMWMWSASLVTYWQFSMNCA